MFLLTYDRWLDSGKDDGKILRRLAHIPTASSRPSAVQPSDGTNSHFGV